TTAVKLVGAGARDDVDRPGRDRSTGEVEVVSLNLELLHTLGREILRGATSDPVVYPRPINRNQSHTLGGAANRDLEEVIDVAGAGGGVVAHGDARLQERD